MTADEPPRSIRQDMTIAPVTIDEMSEVRYVHARSMRAMAAAWAGDEDLAAYNAYIHGQPYAAEIETAVRAGRLHGAYLDRQLLGTGGWSPASDDMESARIRWCHVQPMFAGFGIGLALLTHTETHAADAGHRTLVARATPGTAGFFERAGYGITAHGSRQVSPDRSMPVVFLRKNLRARPGVGLI